MLFKAQNLEKALKWIKTHYNGSDTLNKMIKHHLCISSDGKGNYLVLENK